MRFNQVFAALMLVSLLSAALLPSRLPDRFRATFQGLFTPLARPVSMLAAVVSSRVSTPPPVDAASPERPRLAEDVYHENEQLRLLVASLEGQLQALRELNAERERVGSVRRLCIPVKVVGGETSGRGGLLLASGSLAGIAAGQPVLFPGGIAGTISRAGASGSSVRLLTDADARVAGAFARFTVDNDGQSRFQRLPIEPAVAVGSGKGDLVIATMRLKDIEDAKLKPDSDWFILEDRAWPIALQGYRVGVVRSISPKRDAPLFAEVRIAPDRDLRKLDEVQVMTRTGD
jgi:cell shape-determining protein MreC